MADLNKQNPTGRFTGLSSGYARYRPSYPNPTLSYLTRVAGLCRASLIVDIGSGTGISSRWLAETEATVIGIEPNDEMRATAEQVPLPHVSYQSGNAERTGLADGQADLVMAAQAYHWFDPGRALPETARILKPRGWIALLWNERDENDPFTQAIGDVIRTGPKAVETETARHQAAESFHQSHMFDQKEIVVFPHQQELDEDGLIGRVLSASYAPKDPAERDPFVAALREVVAQYQQNGLVTLRYQTTLHTGRK